MRVHANRLAAVTAILAASMLAGCLTYHPLPLPSAPDLARQPDLTMPARRFDVPGLAPHPVPTHGLDVVTVMTLAVLNNPTLNAARLQAGVARAQLLQAGLLPDPELGASFATSVLNYGGALSLTQDIKTILLRSAAKAAARASERQVNLNILWQEIQVAERARELFIQAKADSKLRAVLGANQTLLQQHYRRDRAAMERDDATIATVAADLTLVANADTAVRQLQMQANLTRHQLNALLGLQPGAHLRLVGTAALAPLSQADLQRAIAALPRRRVDLLALQAGYQSQQQNLRRTILAQFPSFSVAVNLKRDPVEGVNSAGPAVSLSLPLFNRNRGAIAIARATRAALRQQYQAQLDAAAGQTDQVWQANQILAGEVRDLAAKLPLVRAAAAAAQQSLRDYNLNVALYVTAESAFLNKQAELIRLRSSLEVARSALAVLLGLPFAPP